jgi:hypothetical protein
VSGYLPVPAFWWFPEDHDDGPRRVIVPEGTGVHVTCSGRVTHVDDQAVGSVVVRDHEERFHHYRRLRASSITVNESDEVIEGDLIGVVATPNDGSISALLYGVHDAEDRWLNVVELLVGANDPTPLALADDPSIAASVQSYPASGVAERGQDVAPMPEHHSGEPLVVEPGPTPAEVVRAPDVAVPARSEPAEVVHTPAAEAEEPTPPVADAVTPPEADQRPQRSKLAARRPPRRST